MMEVLGFIKLTLEVLVIGLCVGSKIIGDGPRTLKLTKHRKNKKKKFLTDEKKHGIIKM